MQRIISNKNDEVHKSMTEKSYFEVVTETMSKAK